MDQAQNPADVSPAGGGAGIYDVMLPILQQWKTLYNFVASYYVDIGDNPTAADPTTTNWTKSLAYYKAILATGSELGTHSYTHLVNPPTQTFTTTTASATSAGSTTITLNSVPSFAGVTVGMLVSGAGLGSNTPLANGAVGTRRLRPFPATPSPSAMSRADLAAPMTAPSPISLPERH